MKTLEQLTLNSDVYHDFYGKGQIQLIKKETVVVRFYCQFLKGNSFELSFTTDVNFYYKDNKRHINELKWKHN